MKNHHLNDGWQLRQNYKKLQMQSTPPIKFKNLHLSSNFDEIIIFLNLRLIVSWKLGLNWKQLQKGPHPWPIPHPKKIKIDYPNLMKLCMKNIQ